jgi:hypothetical protein
MAFKVTKRCTSWRDKACGTKNSLEYISNPIGTKGYIASIYMRFELFNSHLCVRQKSPPQLRDGLFNGVGQFQLLTWRKAIELLDIA